MAALNGTIGSASTVDEEEEEDNEEDESENEDDVGAHRENSAAGMALADQIWPQHDTTTTAA